MKAKSKTNASAKRASCRLLEQYKQDCQRMRTGELIKKYKLTYDSYRSVKQRAKKEGILLDQRLSDFRSSLLSTGPRINKKFTLDRIDHNGPYSPENCRWADKQTQTLNRSNAVKLTSNGLTLPLKVWARKLGVAPDVLYKRKSTGWSDEEIVAGARVNVSSPGMPWPEGQETRWERAYRDNRLEDESRVGFLLRVAQHKFRLAMNEIRPYEDHPQVPVPAELREAFESAQRELQWAKQKVKEIRAAKASSLFDLLAPTRSYVLDSDQDEGEDESDEDADAG